jgi:hypothetical protein
VKRLRKLKHLSWKVVLSINLVILALGIITLFSKSIHYETSTGTRADVLRATPVTSLINTGQPPLISELIPFYAKPGDGVILSGQNLGYLKDIATIRINNQSLPIESIFSWNQDSVEIVIPENTTSGYFEIVFGNESIRSQYPLVIYTNSEDPELLWHEEEGSTRFEFIRASHSGTLELSFPSSKYTVPVNAGTSFIVLPENPAELRSAVFKSGDQLLPLFVSP